MQARRVTSNKGPATQLTYISQFIGSVCTQSSGSIPLPRRPRKKYLAPSIYAVITAFYLIGPHPFARHNGMGSLPSATMTASWVFTAVLSGVVLLGTAE